MMGLLFFWGGCRSRGVGLYTTLSGIGIGHISELFRNVERKPVTINGGSDTDQGRQSCRILVGGSWGSKGRL